MRLIKLATNLPYCPGDVVLVRPKNLPESIQQMLEVFKEHTTCHPLKPDTKLRVLPRDEDMPVPPALSSPITLLQCAQQYWDLNVSTLEFLKFILHIILKYLVKYKCLRQLQRGIPRPPKYLLLCRNINQRAKPSCKA